MNINNLLDKIYKILFFSLFIVNGFFFTSYMRINIGIFFSILYSLIFYYILKKQKNIKYTKKQKIILIINSLIFTFFLILGTKLHINGDKRFGLYTDIYMTKFNLLDLFAFILLTYNIFILLKYIIYKLKKNFNKITLKTNTFNKKYWLIISISLFILWVPWLLYYYPGIVFSDTLSNIRQALNIINLNNQFSVMYTLFLKLCIKISLFFKGDITFGLCLSTIIQMIYVAISLGYMICWLKSHGANKLICLILILIFGLSPFYVTMSISMIRDTIFSISIMLLTLFLIDFNLSNHKLIKNKSFIIKTILIMLIICFSRNNGFFVLLFMSLTIIVLYLFKYIKNYKFLLCISSIISLSYIFIINPLFKKLNINESYKDSIAIPLYQISSVVVYDGSMNNQEYSYLNKIFPIDKYKENYRPLIIDLFKWNSNFKDYYIENNKFEFYKVYISLMFKNPKLYFNAWALGTYGYWAFNNWELFDVDTNITEGNIGQVKNDHIDGVYTKNYLKHDFSTILKVNDKFISLSVLNWFILFIIVILLMSKNKELIISLSLSLGIILSLLIATPNAYWQRYEFAIYYLIPVFIYILIYGLKGVDINDK